MKPKELFPKFSTSMGCMSKDLSESLMQPKHSGSRHFLYESITNEEQNNHAELDYWMKAMQQKLPDLTCGA
ncbi:unnamed protein product [Heligmosomoides polygyrus]|uniref:PH domain-containing protein n=1 Tax=Heligmosomoides polygyrus TaxID=6339 RepID=A0A183F5D7_HELPZ|nr:unnamed protein product [Heligmosomoides polygyrus]